MATPPFRSVLQTARKCHGLLGGIPHVIVGGLVVRLHGCDGKRPRDVDLIVRNDDWDSIRQAFESAGYAWNKFRKAYLSPTTKCRVDVRRWHQGEEIGETGVPMPDPTHFCEKDGLPVLGLDQLVENKLACGIANGEAGQKHFRDVGCLIAAHRLDHTYAEKLHPSIRAKFRELVDLDS